MPKKETYLVVGSSGFLGNRIATILKPKGSVIQTHFRNMHSPDSIPYDFFNDSISVLLDKFNVDTVIFSGAVEMNPSDLVRPAMERFVRGVKERRVVYLSSDGIFDGQKGQYTEVDIPRPKTLYGRNLAICEELFAQFCNSYCIVRPSYIYGFSGGDLDNRLARTMQMLEQGQTVSLFNDMFKSPLGVLQVAQAVVDLTFLDYVGIVHVAGERVSIFDFHYQAMLALQADIRNLRSFSMPTGEDFLRDTSLDYSLWQKLTHAVPQSINETLSNKKATQPINSAVSNVDLPNVDLGSDHGN